MLRGWTRRGQIELICELKLLSRHAETLASQARSSRGRESPIAEVDKLLRRAWPMLTTLEHDLRAGASAGDTRRELAALHTLAVREIAHADALRHGSHR